jgi:hypothetical protein
MVDAMANTWTGAWPSNRSRDRHALAGCMAVASVSPLGRFSPPTTSFLPCAAGHGMAHFSTDGCAFGSACLDRCRQLRHRRLHRGLQLQLRLHDAAHRPREGLAPRLGQHRQARPRAAPAARDERRGLRLVGRDDRSECQPWRPGQQHLPRALPAGGGEGRRERAGGPRLHERRGRRDRALLPQPRLRRPAAGDPVLYMCSDNAGPKR